MSKAKTATAAAAEPQEFYDSLDATSRDTWDAIGSYGWQPEKTDDGWWAMKDGKTVGPFEYLGTLLDEVQKAETGEAGAESSTSDKGEKDATSDVEVTELDEDHKGNTYLPGVKPIIDPQLASVAGDYFAANTEWKDAGKKRTEKKAALDAVVMTKRHLFHPDPDNSNSLIYHAGGLLIRMAKETATAITVEIDKEKDDEK